MKRAAGDYAFPAASVAIAVFLGVHVLTDHRPNQEPAAGKERSAAEHREPSIASVPSVLEPGGAPATTYDRLAGIDTAALARIPLPVATPVIELTTSTAEPGLQTLYSGVAALRLEGLEMVNTGWPDGRANPSPHLAWSSHGLIDIRLALAERAASGWRITVVGPPHIFDIGGSSIFDWSTMGSDGPGPDHEPFRIPGVRAVDLVGRWPVLVFRYILSQDYVQPGLRETTWHRRTIYTVHVHGAPTAFEHLLTPSPFREAP